MYEQGLKQMNEAIIYFEVIEIKKRVAAELRAFVDTHVRTSTKSIKFADDYEMVSLCQRCNDIYELLSDSFLVHEERRNKVI